MSDSGPGGAPDATHLNSLLLRVANSDQAAFEALYQATANRLFAICLRLLRDRGEAEDVLQEVFTTVWHKAGQFDAGKAAAMTWMGMIARNRAIDRLRAGPARMALESIEVPEDLPRMTTGSRRRSRNRPPTANVCTTAWIHWKPAARP